MALQDGCHYFELVIETSVEGSGSFEFGLRFGRHARFVHEEHAQVSILIDKSQLIAESVWPCFPCAWARRVT